MKYPWMPLFWGDFLANTLHLSAQELGAYFLLIAHAWEHDAKVSVKDAQRIARVGNRHWGEVRVKLDHFFEPSGGLLGGAVEVVHTRVAKELAYTGEISNKRKDAALQMHANRRASAVQVHMHPPSQPLESSLGEVKAVAPSRAGAPNGARAPSPPPEGGRQGMSPDLGDEYRAPPATKSDNQLREIPDRPASGSKWRRHTDDELKAIYAAKHEPSDDQ